MKTPLWTYLSLVVILAGAQTALACGAPGGSCSSDASSTSSGGSSSTPPNMSVDPNAGNGNGWQNLLGPGTTVGNPIDLGGGNKYRFESD
ncbi:MAG: hypothetical protein JO142_19175, partial [Burkholderiales bacterium]|nr:hypothetical protein [Burkholderiales bacterium]